ncbi:MAG TPA: pilus assembly protein TadG-related protein, partial [Roseiarcus sp.]|nr:pilus assembly protein TadG-related protein [Roseiarcus sp.]
MSFLRAAWRNNGGNVSTMYALLAPVLIFGVGGAIDYGRAAQIRSKLNAAADAAALAALTPAMLQQTNATAQAAATSMFKGLADGVSGLVTPVPAPTVTVSNPANPLVRNVTVSYSVSYSTMFGAVIGMNTMTVSGSSSASAQTPPNIDFYVLLDNSPSMALPSTTAGITQMQNLTPLQSELSGDGSVGCAFACHQASTGNGDTAGNPCLKNGAYSTPTQSSGSYKNVYCSGAQGTQIDNYALARYNNIPLRLDELNSGITTLLNTAATTAQSSQFKTPPVYRFAIYEMDSSWQTGLTQLVPTPTQTQPQPVTPTTNYQSLWTTASATFGVMEMYSNNNMCANSACSSGTTTSGQGDINTNYDDSLGKLSQSSYIPNPGNGTNQQGDT